MNMVPPPPQRGQPHPAHLQRRPLVRRVVPRLPGSHAGEEELAGGGLGYGVGVELGDGTGGQSFGGEQSTITYGQHSCASSLSS